MITIHEKTAKTFGTLGLGALLPASCLVTEELNGAFELEMEHPYDEGGKWRRIERGRVLYAPTPTGRQPFRIYNTTPTMSGIKVNARHIFYDLLDNFCGKVQFIGAAPQAISAIQTAMAYPMPFTFSTDIDRRGRLAALRVNPVQALLSDDNDIEGFVKAFGGELLRDHFSVAMKKRIGTERNVAIRYGKNLVGLEVDEDEGDVRTQVKAFGKDGISATVDSPHINDYIYPKIMALEDNGAETVEELQGKAMSLFSVDKVDLPKINIKVDFVPLAKTEEYRDFAALEEVRLGDTVTVINEKMGFSKQAEVISYKWDCLRGQYGQVELGDFMPTIAGVVTSGAESYKIAVSAGSEAKNAISLISGRITITQDALYVSVDAEDYKEAKRLFRFGENGLQFTAAGIGAGESEWKTLVSPDGELVLPEE